MTKTKACYLGVVIALMSIPGSVALAASLSTSQRLERLELRVEKITKLTLEIDALRRENRQLRGELEELQYALETLRSKQRDLYLDVDQRLSQVQSGVAPAPPSTPTVASDTNSAKPLAASGNPKRAQADYDAAYALLSPEQRRYDEAIVAFRGFLNKFPGHPLAANAQYWLAEASYVLQDNATALTEFQKVVADYPSSQKVPGALLKIGYIKYAAGDIDGAKEVLNGLLAQYPNSSAAGMARQRLQRIQSEAR